MATTTNYGWTTPDDTALVKDGAAAIRTLGSSVDTTTKNLNPETTLGDIAYRSSTANVKTRLGIGSTGDILTVTGGVPTWAAPAGGGSMTEIASGSLSSTSVVLSSIPGTYRNLFLYVLGAQVSALTLLVFRLNGNTSGIYTEKGFVLNDTAWRNNQNQVYFSPTTQAVNIPTSANTHAYGFYIEEYSQTSSKNMTTSYRDSASAGADSYNTFNNFGSTTAITSITIAGSNGTSTFSAGTYKLYGVK
jgi:hypothetical protein